MAMNAEILIVEDSATQAEQLLYLLEKHGYRGVVAQSGEQALSMMRQRLPTMVLSDIVMPGITGYELCRQIKAQFHSTVIPVILVTSLSDAKDVIAGLSCGADGFIRKPYDDHYLLTRIQYCLTNIELRTQERVQVGVELMLHGERHFISAARQQILDLLISTYEQAVGLNAELQQANRDLESFTSSVSHDLRSPLSAAVGFAEYLQTEYASKLDECGQMCVQQVVDGCHHMIRLIDDLLRLSRLGRQSISFENVDTGAMVTKVLHELARTQTLPTVDCDTLPDALGDGSLLHQVWANLLGNAVKYSSKQAVPLIHIGSEISGREVIYQVRDNGAGFDMRQYEKLFCLFQRLHSNEDFEGTGVGLAIVHRIVSRHGGRVWAESSVGAGATFYFSLPLTRS